MCAKILPNLITLKKIFKFLVIISFAYTCFINSAYSQGFLEDCECADHRDRSQGLLKQIDILYLHVNFFTPNDEKQCREINRDRVRASQEISENMSSQIYTFIVIKDFELALDIKTKAEKRKFNDNIGDIGAIYINITCIKISQENDFYFSTKITELANKNTWPNIDHYDFNELNFSISRSDISKDLSPTQIFQKTFLEKSRNFLVRYIVESIFFTIGCRSICEEGSNND